APLAAGGIEFYALQFGKPAEELAKAPAGMQLIDHTAKIADFADTAALLPELDLTICVDTALAHLAGAMGKPAWVLLPFTPDFRWLLEGRTTSWYPSMRLFRQKTFGDWAEVIENVAAELRKFAEVNTH
ncbi:MAG: glycosyltransferase family 9 protein, partial [Tepidisphaeraceae bacterium]